MRFEDVASRLDALEYWIRERHNIWKRKTLGSGRNGPDPKPWTSDTVFQRYRFCNVHREKDKVTQQLALLLRGEAGRRDPDLWFAYVVARLVNWPPTVTMLQPIVPWDKAWFLRKLQEAEQENGKVWGGAYIVSTNGREMPKPKYIADEVLDPLWQAREKLRPVVGDTLERYHARLLPFMGMGGFMAAQVIADLKHAVGTPLHQAEDRATWAASGPGSRRGLNRLLDRDTDAPWKERDWAAALRDVRIEMFLRLARLQKTDVTFPEIEAQDMQNCLCEFDKYVRVRLGEGRPRALYAGLPED